MSRLIVVSNRVPNPDRPPAGGLAVAVRAALNERGGIWLGWSGKSCGEEEPGPLVRREEGPITYALTDLSDRDLSEYYQGFANSVLWPLCHYRIDLTDYARRDARGYFRVNRIFAERLAPLVQPDDLIWIHDYHLIPLASELRRMGLRNRIGFFLHIPWPAPDVYLTLPISEMLLRAMTACDLIGFQTEFDAENFGLCLKRSGIALPVPGEDGIYQVSDGMPEEISGRRFKVGAFPIGIDSEAFARTARNAVRNPAMRKFRESLGGQQLIVGVDRLDYTKGLPQRMNGYRRFLEANPNWLGRVTFLQITPKSRSGVAEYDALQREVAELAGHTAGALGQIDWTPVRYMNRALGHHVLAGIYRMARVALVTPLRDGMNLVAKEYVAAQDPEDPGILILSRFAGAAYELGRGSLLVNPYDEEAIANAIAQAVSMPREKRQELHAIAAEKLSKNSVFDWCADYLDQLAPPQTVAETPA
ncbi:alpha,alpha-trehalose-phosphate synthase (UDP-forming) [Paenirhodobacter populi]|uniref:Trehalose-6-phosphate synthase n=1 Tax=Paenirhodobacter populi TaxID=2306993 RepID=A0A443J195_9RHOB|nr:trehalose-6-phosphate synthase [Sinirhodobacter populi]RWR04874.1 trehalose-6-phosphate synthase [Sinirhodobacter populi]RWR14318.1 trehalose-6-phosphate synthase [Sinirhodobacter populi]RWR17709.1 trehalose-6-phosphate synthase [Sinirhodobacter populi]RWR31949.1 trehalose-6-phosphate synthase [Sinirhodobacter populi]RWR33702.1 trehalose-6-phosphate synthase [Sinirhodobacter populi]